METLISLRLVGICGILRLLTAPLSASPMRCLRILAALLPWCWLAASCTVYAPMQPTMPLVYQRGQAQLGASIQALGRAEVTGAYAPLPYLVVVGGLTASPRLGEQNFLVTRQYELGAGFYQALGQSWLLSGLGGAGQAYSHRGYRGLDASPRQYEASYYKLYGQVGVAYQGPLATFSLTYRLTQVQFNYLQDARLGSLPLTAMLRHELALSNSRPLGSSDRWQLVQTAGISVSGTSRLDDNSGYPTYGAREYEANRNLLPAFLASIGVVYTLHPTQR